MFMFKMNLIFSTITLNINIFILIVLLEDSHNLAKGFLKIYQDFQPYY